MKKVANHLLVSCIAIALAFVIGYVYWKIACFLSENNNAADFICSFKWKDGLILLCSYACVKLLSYPLDFDSKRKRVMVTMGLYAFSYAILAFPFFIASIFQPMVTNTLLHSVLIVVFVEWASGRIFNPWQNKTNAPQ